MLCLALKRDNGIALDAPLRVDRLCLSA